MFQEQQEQENKCANEQIETEKLFHSEGSELA